MATTFEHQLSFAGGEVDPILARRSDLAKYRVGLQKAENCFVEPQGVLRNRPPTEYVRSRPSTNLRLIPFRFDRNESYSLVFENLTMRVVKDGAMLGAPYVLVTPFATEHLAGLKFNQINDVMYLTHPLVAPQKLVRTGDTAWTIAPLSVGASIAAPGSPTATFSAASGSATQASEYKVTATAEETGEESLPTAAFSDAGSGGVGTNSLSWSAVTGASEYTVYKKTPSGGAFGYIGLAQEGTTFEDAGLNPDESDTPPTARDPFSGAGDYPAVSTLTQQRLGFGNTVNNPLRVEFSQSAILENFSVSRPTKAEDAIEQDVFATQNSQIVAMVSLQNTLVFTEDTIFELRPTDGAGFAPGQVSAYPQTTLGSNTVDPLLIKREILFVETQGDRVHALSYSINVEGFDTIDVTLLAQHLFGEKEVVRWAYAQTPHNLIVIVFNDGTCASLTYLREQDVYAFAPWTTHQGTFLDVVSIPENGRDVLYFAIRRIINGTPVVWIERLRKWKDDLTVAFCDAQATYSGVNTRFPTGFDHLDGETLVGLADKAAVRDRVSVSGTAELSLAAGDVTLGLPYQTVVQPLPLIAEPTEPKSVSHLHVSTQMSGGVKAGVSLDDLAPVHASFPTEFDGPAVLEANDFEVPIDDGWDKRAQVYLVHDAPLPFTLLAISRQFTVGR